jgi:hypothetical protein
MTTVPTTTSEVTAAWMTEALRQSGTIPDDVTVASVIADPGAAGVGFMGEVATVGLVYDGDAGNAPTSVVVKFPSRDPGIRAMMHPTRIYEREHRFYRELAPESPVRTPAIHHVTCQPADEPADEQYVIVMEDLSGLELGDQVVGASVAQAEAALVGLARHHARFWDGAGLDAADFIPAINGPLNQAGQGIYMNSLPGFLEVFGERLDPAMLEIAHAYTAANPRMLDALAAMPNTLVHFDYRVDNMFFDPADGSVVVIDWQAISRGGGAADVGYFLAQNVATDVRREHEDRLLHLYHDTLVENGVTGYDYDTFHEHYRLGVIYGWIIPVMAIGSLDVSSERAMALWTAVIERTQTAVLEHDAGEFVR